MHKSIFIRVVLLFLPVYVNGMENIDNGVIIRKENDLVISYEQGNERYVKIKYLACIIGTRHNDEGVDPEAVIIPYADEKYTFLESLYNNRQE